MLQLVSSIRSRVLLIIAVVFSCQGVAATGDWSDISHPGDRSFAEWLGSIRDHCMGNSICKKKYYHASLGMKEKAVVRKYIVYVFSLGFIRIRNYILPRTYSWWSAITPNLYLSSIPLRHHLPKIVTLGVTDVLAVNEPFELQKGIIATPITAKTWARNKINFTNVVAADFFYYAY